MGAEAGDVKNVGIGFEWGPYTSLSDLAGQIANSIGRQLDCDQVIVTISGEESNSSGWFLGDPRISSDSVSSIFDHSGGAATFRGKAWSLPFFVSDLGKVKVSNALVSELQSRGVRSFGAFPLLVHGELLGIVECSFTRSLHRWRPDEAVAFERLSFDLESVDRSDRSATRDEGATQSEESRGQYTRMARYGNLIIIVTDSQFGITDVFGSAESLIGITPEEMKNNAEIWDRIIDPRDQAALRRRILRLRIERGELREEVRVVHQKTGQIRWVMLRALPQFSSSGGFLGWEGFGIDITKRRQAQDALESQSARVEALFEVARSLQGQTDPALVVLRGLRALIKATKSDCGYGCFYHREVNEVEVVAAQGLSERYLDNMEGVLRGPSLLREVIQEKSGIVIGDLQKDPRAYTTLAKIESIRSTIVMPLTADGEVYGALVLFTREVDSYLDSDYELVSAAATQIALAVRQTYMFEVERQQSQSLGALYRISHELAKYRTPREIAEHAFPLLQHEFTLRRAWLGIINDQGTHLVGQSGFGSGLRRRLQEIQIELNLQHDFLDEAIRTQVPVVVPANAKMECSGLQRVVALLKLETLVIVPLVALGQVVGVLVVEPALPHMVVKGPRLQLLSSMASEMATVFMARRFEAKLADGLKMRMAGLLASGVAHNFNNMLQAILGQVALLEMQMPKGSPGLESARMISDAAKRGAALVSQLINFATQGQGARHVVNVNSIISDSDELYRSLLGKRIELRVNLSPASPDVVVDTQHIQQVITNLLINSKEAIADRDNGSVEISIATVRLRSSEIDPELAPGEYARIDIRDNGVGMNAEQQLRCFEPFFTTKNVDPGTGVGLSGSGLGLSAAYSIIKQHHGLITAHSVLKEGSTFSVYLPVQAPVAMGADDSATPGWSHSGRGGVLLLGLETGAQPFVSSLLESLGYTSRSVYDLTQARDVLTRQGGEWSCMLVDLDTLGEDILVRCRQLLAEYPELSLVSMSASPRDEGVSTGSAREAFVEKPLGVWSVEAALQRLSGVRPVED